MKLDTAAVNALNLFPGDQAAGHSSTTCLYGLLNRCQVCGGRCRGGARGGQAPAALGPLLVAHTPCPVRCLLCAPAVLRGVIGVVDGAMRARGGGGGGMDGGKGGGVRHFPLALCAS